MFAKIAAFEFRYGAANIAGEYSGQLKNSGEHIRYQATDTSTIADFTSGSVTNASPEVYAHGAPGALVAAAPYDAEKADVWSLGVLLFVMAVGRPPWTEPASNPSSCSAASSPRRSRQPWRPLLRVGRERHAGGVGAEKGRTEHARRLRAERSQGAQVRRCCMRTR